MLNIYNYPKFLILIRIWKLHPSIDVLVVFMIGVINAYCLMPTPNLSMSITASEEGPIEPSLAFKNPEYFKSDIFALDNKYMMWANSIKWFPALCYKFLNINPEIFHIGLTYSQTAFLLTAAYSLAKTIFNDRVTGFYAVILIVISSPYFNNLGAYGDLFFMPYSTWISIAPLLMSATALIEKKNKKSLILFTIGTSVHPGMGTSFYGILMAIILLENGLNIFLKIRKIIFYSLPVVFFGLVSMLIRIYGSAKTVPTEWEISNRLSFHRSAWVLSPELPTFMTTAYTLTTVLILILIIYKNYFFSDEIKKISFCFILASLFFVIIHAVSYSNNISSIYTINLTRITIFLSIFYTIIIARLLHHSVISIKEGLFIFNLLVFLLLIFQTFFALVIYSLVLAFQKQSSKENRVNKNVKDLLIFLIPIINIVLFFASISKSWWKFPEKYEIVSNLFHTPNGILIRGVVYYCNNLMLITFVSIFIVLIVIGYKNKFILEFFLVMILVIATLSTLGIRYVQSSTRLTEHKDWMNVQLWAKQYTKPSETFILPSGLDTYSAWTTLSNRARIDNFVEPYNLYLYSKDFSNRKAKVSFLPPAPCPNCEASSIEKYYSEVANIFSANYFVSLNSWTKINWQIVYSNNQYSVYLVPHT